MKILPDQREQKAVLFLRAIFPRLVIMTDRGQAGDLGAVLLPISF